MYTTCIFCHHSLGTNEVIEPFPVGRRLAFDPRKGRLWVVCRRCERWNLSPFEERWEALEECEREFRDARKRVASDNIGLARLNEGLELVRIGEPLRPEFAAWRYGDQFGRRRRRMILLGAAAATAGGAVIVGSSMLTGVIGGGGYGVWQLAQGIVRAYNDRRLVARIPQPDGTKLVVRGRHLRRTRLALAEQSDEGAGVRLQLAHKAGNATIEGRHAVHAISLLMPGVNRSGGTKRQVRDAVRRIESFGDPVRFLSSAAREDPRTRRNRPAGIHRLPIDTRLAVEMAVNEENERIALEGELALLEMAWEEAEEIAAISDRLTIPRQVERRFDELRRQVRGA